ncbi:MAG: hypothetical protein IJ573_05685 [Clostridia bacterium]|nr:hypothetical protein [Clostridia bacterium]
MNKSAFRGLLRLAAFLMVFAAVICLGDVFFLRTDLFARRMLLEMQERDDLELVFIGSSVCRDHVNAQLISEATGKTAFNASIPCLAMQGSIALTEELYRTNAPETIVLVVEPYTFETEREGIEAEDTMMPWLSSFRTKLDYYKRLVAADGWYMDRILLFRDMGAQTPLDIAKTVGLRFFPHRTIELLGNESRDGNIPVTYQEQGFVRYETDLRADDAVKEKLKRQVTGWEYGLLPASKQMLLEYRDLLAAHGTELIVLIYPNMNAHNLAEPSFLGYNRSLTFFCRNNGIECVNFALAKPELLPNLDPYYFDIYHVNGEGADLFSSAVARWLNLRDAGEDTTPLFYGSNEEYLQAFDTVTNAWAERYDPAEDWDPAREQDEGAVRFLADGEMDLYLANCNHSPFYTPEYRFFLLDGEMEVPLTPWQQEGILRCGAGDLDHRVLRVYARLTGQQSAVYYDFRTSPEY